LFSHLIHREYDNVAAMTTVLIAIFNLRLVMYRGASLFWYTLLVTRPAQLPMDVYRPLIMARAFRLGMFVTVHVEPRISVGYAYFAVSK
jgi:hypothetical protein